MSEVIAKVLIGLAVNLLAFAAGYELGKRDAVDAVVEVVGEGRR